MSIKSNIIVPNEPINRFGQFSSIESSISVEPTPAKLSMIVLPSKTEALTPEEPTIEDLKKKTDNEMTDKTNEFYKFVAVYGGIVFVFILIFVIYIKSNSGKIMGGLDDSDDLTENSIYVQ